MAKTWCGGQDSNLRTDKEWDLNPPPLTKLGDPAQTSASSLSFQLNAQAEPINPALFTITITLSVVSLSVVVITPESFSRTL